VNKPLVCEGSSGTRESAVSPDGVKSILFKLLREGSQNAAQLWEKAQVCLALLLLEGATTVS
jgi:hypothetical protein